MKKNLNKSILITGGTGSFGKAFIKYTLNNFKNIKKLIIYSRDELKQHDLSKIYPEKKYPFIRYFIGDVRDLSRLEWALKDIDIVIHAAALKQVPAAEYNPIEAIKTNIFGAQNLIEASLKNNVQKVIALSTDKAASPLNLYGATKLCSEKLFIAANKFKGKSNISFSVVRYGNVIGSRGSVVPLFIEQKKRNSLNITDKRMTRFLISLNDGVELVYWSLFNCFGGEVVVPKIPSILITDIAKAIAPKAKIKIIGIRPGEKLHETLMSSDESAFTYTYKSKYVILDILNSKVMNYYKSKGARKVSNNFEYNSFSNKDYLRPKEFQKVLNKLKI